MSKRTVVSDYVEKKLNNIKKDSFLEELSILGVPYSKQREIIMDEIDSIYQYIKIIKENKKCYEINNNRKVLKKPIKLYISNLRKIISKYFEYSKYLRMLERYQTRKDLIDKRIEFDSNEVTLTDEQIRILNSVNEENIKKVSFGDLGDIAKYLINDYEYYNIQLELVLKELGSRYKYDEYNEESYIILSSVKGAVNNKINTLDKDDYRRVKLREYKKYIKSIIDIIREKEDRKYDYRYDVVEYLIEDEYCFNRLLEEMPDIVNLCDRDGYSLSYNILEKYLDAYLLQLLGKHKGKSKDDLLKTYHKIISHPYYFNSSSNIKATEELIDNFKNVIKNGRFKRDKYLDVLTNLENINNVLVEEKHTSKIDYSDIADERAIILRKTSDSYRVDLCDEDTIVLCTKNEKYYNYAYSVTKNSNGTHILKVHITDVKEFIKHDSMLDLFLKENISKGENNWLDDELLNKFSLNLGEIKPVFTFEMEVYPSGKINNFKCYKSNIKVNDIYTYEEANREIKNHNLRFLTYLEINYFLNKDIDKDNYALSMSDVFTKKVFDNVGSYFKKHKLPYIYKYQKNQDNARYIKNMTALNSVFSKVSKEHFKKFYQIICDDINYSRYTSNPENHTSLNQKYYTDLFIPLYSYIGIFLQEMIDQFYLTKQIGELLNIKKAIWENERNYVVKHANDLKIQKRVSQHNDKIKKLKGN